MKGIDSHPHLLSQLRRHVFRYVRPDPQMAGIDQGDRRGVGADQIARLQVDGLNHTAGRGMYLQFIQPPTDGVQGCLGPFRGSHGLGDLFLAEPLLLEFQGLLGLSTINRRRFSMTDLARA